MPRLSDQNARRPSGIPVSQATGRKPARGHRMASPLSPPDSPAPRARVQGRLRLPENVTARAHPDQELQVWVCCGTRGSCPLGRRVRGLTGCGPAWPWGRSRQHPSGLRRCKSSWCSGASPARPTSSAGCAAVSCLPPCHFSSSVPELALPGSSIKLYIQSQSGCRGPTPPPPGSPALLQPP